VLVRDPLGRFKPQALLCTTLETSPEQALVRATLAVGGHL
jgi:hypothetical protein